LDAEPYYVVNGSYDVVSTVLSGHVVQAKRYNCDERYIIVKKVVNFLDIRDYAQPKLLNLRTTKNRMLMIKERRHV